MNMRRLTRKDSPSSSAEQDDPLDWDCGSVQSGGSFKPSTFAGSGHSLLMAPHESATRSIDDDGVTTATAVGLNKHNYNVGNGADTEGDYVCVTL